MKTVSPYLVQYVAYQYSAESLAPRSLTVHTKCAITSRHKLHIKSTIIAIIFYGLVCTFYKNDRI